MKLSWPGTVIAVALLAAIVIVALYVSEPARDYVLASLLGAFVGVFLPNAVKREEQPPRGPRGPRIPPLAVLLLVTAIAIPGCGFDWQSAKAGSCDAAQAWQDFVCPNEPTSGGEELPNEKRARGPDVG